MNRYYSLKELCELTGIEPRTIRSYIQEGLMLGPETRGPKARYTDYHRKRLQTIRTLRDSGLSLAEIRRYLLLAPSGRKPGMAPLKPFMVEEALREHYYAEQEMRSFRQRMEDKLRPRKPWAEHEVLYQMGKVPDEAPSSARAPARDELGSSNSLRECVRRLEAALGTARSGRPTPAMTLREIEVTPELSLRIRGNFGPEGMALFHRLADALRAGLMGDARPPGEPDSTR